MTVGTGTLEPGRMLGRYRLLRVLGSGAMGDVYLAEDPQIERQLAIKTVRVADGKPDDVEDRKRRLLREAKAAGRLIHPHVVTLFDAGEADGILYLAFEYVAGSDLSQRMDMAPRLTLGEVLRVVRETADALGAAHQQGIIHRDVKPSNILLDTRGRVKVADFGIAKVVGQATELTMTGSVVGSPHYLSPEQVRGEELDGRTDIFSLGVVLYELLGHRRPFLGETLTTLVYQILHQDPVPIASLRPDLAPRLEQLLRGMLAKDREQRFPDAASVVAEISTLERSLPSEALTAPAAEAAPLDQTHRMPSSGGATVNPRSPTTPTLIANAPTSVSGAPLALPPADLPPLVTAPRRSPLPILLAVGGALIALLAAAWFVVVPKLFPTKLPPSTHQAEVSPVQAAPPSAPPAPAPTKPVEVPLSTPPVKPPVPVETPVTKPSPIAQVPSTKPSTQSPAPPPTQAQPSAPPVTPPAAKPKPSTPAPVPREPEQEPEEVTPALPAGTTERSSGLVLTFDVKPGTLVARVRAVNEGHLTVIGAAEDYTGKRNSQSYALPGPGEYLLQLCNGGSPVVSYLLHARAGGPTQPIVFDLSKSGKRP
ncbi:MAG: serine/threonine-protein kinase [Acidobacteriota bacterium]